MNNKVYGIDLGTTCSCIARVDWHGVPVMLPNPQGDLITPSVVYFENEDSVVIGETAKKLAALEPDQAVFNIKRVMGAADWEFNAFGKCYKPQDVSSLILRGIVGNAEKATGERIENVVITCPAYFGIAEKEATKQAGILAGLNVLYVIPEPTAAALCYGIEQSEDQVILVYDLGGGTFDVSIIEVRHGEISVISTSGDDQLGGVNWDDAVVNYLASRFEKETAIDAEKLLGDFETYLELVDSAEEGKRNLSSRQYITRSVRFGGKHVKIELSREKFDQITAPYLGRTLSLTEQGIEKAKEKGFSTIDKLLLVGGSTYMPQVKEAVQARFPMDVLQFDPNQAVAKGAAIFGFRCYLDEQIKIKVAKQAGGDAAEVDLHIGGATVEETQRQIALDHGLTLPAVKKFSETSVFNVSSKSFGIVVVDPIQDQEVVANIITKNTRVPVSVTKQLNTHAEGQTVMALRCMENQSDSGRPVELRDCTSIGNAEFHFSKPLPVGSPVEITFSLGQDGLLQLKGRDSTTGKEIKAQFKTDSVMQVEELEESKSRNLALTVY